MSMALEIANEIGLPLSEPQVAPPLAATYPLHE
jgi:hypothetical protein